MTDDENENHVTEDGSRTQVADKENGIYDR